MDLQGKYILVAGCGVSGIAAAQLLHRVGAKPVLFDTNEALKEEEVRARLSEDCEALIAIGKVDDEIEDKLELVVLSPGIPVDADFVEVFREKGLPIWGEIELAYQIIGSLNFPLAVNRCAKRVDHTSKIFFANRNTCSLSGTDHTGSFFDSAFPSKKNATNFILSNVLNHSFHASVKQ